MHLSELVRTQPHQAAVIASDGTSLDFEQLDDESRRLANHFLDVGLRPGDTIAVVLENTARYFSVVWAAMRSQLYIVPVNWHLSTDEAAYIVDDCGAKALVTSHRMGELGAELARRSPNLSTKLAIGAVDGFEDLDATLASGATERPDAEMNGSFMFYSSGTTGQPKGIKPKSEPAPFGTDNMLIALLSGVYGFTTDSVYLCPGPLYHAAPLGWSFSTQVVGGQVVVLDRFDAETCLAMIEKHRVTHAQFVPTMFVRMLKLDPAIRAKYDLSSLQTVVHAAAPCPPDVKRAMIDWLGPIVHEYYAGSEANGFFAINSQEWLDHPGSVGKPLVGTPHIVDDDGVDVPIGQDGQIWIESHLSFEYHGDPDKTAGVFNDRGWSTLGDLGHLDDEGFLYLSDRRTDLIITGGVNVYPREVEDALAMHPAVGDVAVIGVPNEEMGQEVRAVVQVADGVTPSPELAEELIEHCGQKLARFKRPRHVDFVEDMPRLPTGKILRRVLRDRYHDAD